MHYTGIDFSSGPMVRVYVRVPSRPIPVLVGLPAGAQTWSAMENVLCCKIRSVRIRGPLGELAEVLTPWLLRDNDYLVVEV